MYGILFVMEAYDHNEARKKLDVLGAGFNERLYAVVRHSNAEYIDYGIDLRTGLNDLLLCLNIGDTRKPVFPVLNLRTCRLI